MKTINPSNILFGFFFILLLQGCFDDDKNPISNPETSSSSQQSQASQPQVSSSISSSSSLNLSSFLSSSLSSSVANSSSLANNSSSSVQSSSSSSSPVQSSSSTTPIQSSSSANQAGIILEQKPDGFYIQLDVKSDGWGTDLGTFYVQAEGSYTLNIQEENPYNGQNTQYSIYASASGFYSEMIASQAGEAFDVDLDSVISQSQGITGVLIGTQVYFADCITPNTEIVFTSPSGSTERITTDAKGRYYVNSTETGTWKATFQIDASEIILTLENQDGLTYQDLFFDEPMVAYAPNIYLYPETSTQVQVKLKLPQGNGILISEPEYQSGWNVTVDAEGWINHGEYGYLFYEVSSFPTVQSERGWMIPGDNLSAGLSDLLSQHGFKGREITDFLEYWLPILPASPWYQILPQDPQSISILDITPRPQTVQRVIWLIRTLPVAVETQEPRIKTIERDGFTVMEWGVIKGF